MQRQNTLHRVQQGGLSEYSVDERAALGLLEHLDKDQLQALLDDERKLNDLIDDLQQIKNVEVDREMLMAGNKSLAEFNLSKQPNLESSREMLTYAYSETDKYKEEFDTLKSIIESRTSTPSFDSIQAVLMAKAAETDEKTEMMYESFVTGQLDCDAFVEQYIERRTRYHVQKIKSEKLGEIIQGQGRSPVQQAQPLRPPPPAPRGAPTGSSYQPQPAYPPQYQQYGGQGCPT